MEVSRRVDERVMREIMTRTTRWLTTPCFSLALLARQSIRQWDNFFATNPKYHKVGTLQLPKIDPESPIPEPCD